MFLNIALFFLQVAQFPSYPKMRLPRHLRDSLLQELEINILEVIQSKEVEKMLLSDVFFLCALLSNFMYGSYVTRYVPVFVNFSLYGHSHVIFTCNLHNPNFRCGLELLPFSYIHINL